MMNSDLISAIVIGVIQLLGSFASIYLIERAGRKVSFVLSCFEKYSLNRLACFSLVPLCFINDRSSIRIYNIGLIYDVQGVELWCGCIELDSDRFIFYHHFSCYARYQHLAIRCDWRSFASECERIRCIFLHGTPIIMFIYYLKIFTSFNRFVGVARIDVPIFKCLPIRSNIYYFVCSRNKRQKLWWNYEHTQPTE